VIINNDRAVYVWKFQHLPLESNGPLGQRIGGKESIFGVNDDCESPAYAVEQFQQKLGGNVDSISSVTASEEFIFVARESGFVHRYSLPNIIFEHKYGLDIQSVRKLVVNCNSTKLRRRRFP